MAQHVSIPQHFTHSRGADISSSLQQTVGSAGFQSQGSALLQKLLRPIYHMPFPCLLPTKASSTEHFAGLSFCFGVEFCFGVFCYQQAKYKSCRQKKFLLHNALGFNRITCKHSKQRLENTLLIPWTTDQ